MTVRDHAIIIGCSSYAENVNSIMFLSLSLRQVQNSLRIENYIRCPIKSCNLKWRLSRE